MFTSVFKNKLNLNFRFTGKCNMISVSILMNNYLQQILNTIRIKITYLRKFLISHSILTFTRYMATNLPAWNDPNITQIITNMPVNCNKTLIVFHIF